MQIFTTSYMNNSYNGIVKFVHIYKHQIAIVV